MTDNELVIRNVDSDNYAISFCKDFVCSKKPKYIFGINNYTLSIMSIIKINGIIDEYTQEKSFNLTPIVSLDAIPSNSLVISVVVAGKPLIVEKKLAEYQFEYLDYFSFVRYSNLKLKNIEFWDGAAEDIKINFNKYNSVYKMLADSKSKDQFYNLLNFRASHNLKYMRGFENLLMSQYFEDFLDLKISDEVFIDVGAYDGCTSKEFAKRFPKYKEIHLFDPIADNLNLAKKILKNYNNIYFHQQGLAAVKSILFFEENGTYSKSAATGKKVAVDKLDNVINSYVGFIKMDIEGGECDAIIGSTEVILKYHPVLAISAYHKKDDLWRIPEVVFKIRKDYNIYLRHYTEGSLETVLFFVPIKINNIE